jgi:hypothetical protein
MHELARTHLLVASVFLLCSWNEDNLSERLLTGISENKFIKRALFPPVGTNASTSKGGGKTKVATQWQLSAVLFGDGPKYKDSIAAATTPKEQLVWASKVKDRLRMCVCCLISTQMLMNFVLAEWRK